MVRAAEMGSVGHVFDELAEQSGTDGVAESVSGRVYSLCCGSGCPKSESEVSGKLGCREQIDSKCGSK